MNHHDPEDFEVDQVKKEIPHGDKERKKIQQQREAISCRSIILLGALAGVGTGCAAIEKEGHVPSGSVQIMTFVTPSEKESGIGVKASVSMPRIVESSIINTPSLQMGMMVVSTDTISVPASFQVSEGVTYPPEGVLSVNLSGSTGFGHALAFEKDTSRYTFTIYGVASLNPSLSLPLDEEQKSHINLAPSASIKGFIAPQAVGENSGLQWIPAAGMSISFDTRKFENIEIGAGVDVYSLPQGPGQWSSPIISGNFFIKVPLKGK